MGGKRILKGFLLTAILTMAMGIAALAGEWRRDAVGWWYQVDDQHYYASGIQPIDGKYYMFDARGYMMTGWQQTTGGDWYYAYPDGSMAVNKWVGDYYLGPELKMLTSTWVGEYYVGADGKWIAGMTKQSGSDPIYGHYSTEGLYAGHTGKHHIMMDVYKAASGSDYDTVISFGLFDAMGYTGDYYSKSNPNGDRITGSISYGDNGTEVWGKADNDGKEYHVSFDGEDTITLYWRSTGAWDVNGAGGIVFKRKSGTEGYYGNGYSYGGGMG